MGISRCIAKVKVKVKVAKPQDAFLALQPSTQKTRGKEAVWVPASCIRPSHSSRATPECEGDIVLIIFGH